MTIQEINTLKYTCDIERINCSIYNNVCSKPSTGWLSLTGNRRNFLYTRSSNAYLEKSPPTHSPRLCMQLMNVLIAYQNKIETL